MGFLDRLRRTHEPPDLPGPNALPPPSPDARPKDPSDVSVPTLPRGPRVDVVGESYYRDAYRALFGPPSSDWRYFDQLVAWLVPEPHNEYDPAAVAVRIGGRKVGHLSRDDARVYRGVIDEAIVAHGRATAYAIVRCAPSESSPRASEFGAVVYLAAHPPPGARTPVEEVRLAEGGVVSVSNEEHHQGALITALGGHDVTVAPQPVVATLVRADNGNPWVKKPTGPVVEVRIGNETVGYLTRTMSDRYFRFVDEAAAQGKWLTAAAMLRQRSKAGREIIEIALDAIPRRFDQTTIETLDVEVAPAFIVDPETGILHRLVDETPGDPWEVKCGLMLQSSQPALVGTTKPWVGRVEIATGRIYDGRYPWCGDCRR